MFRGKKYQQSAKLIDRSVQYDPTEALDLVVKGASAKFDETVELHVRLGVDGRHADQQVRGAVVLPNGTEIPEFYVLEYPDWVNIIAVTADGEFVMIRQYRHGIDQTRYELVAGCVDPGEDPLTAAKRELYEETGFGGGEWRKISVISGNPSTTTNWTHCYVAEGVERVGSQHLETSEDISVHLLSADEVRWLLDHDEIKQAMMVAPLWKYFIEKKLV